MSAVAEAPLRVHRFSRVEYDRMVDADVFGPDDNIELLDGEIIDMAPQKSRHTTAVTLIAETLRKVFGAGFHVRVQMPLLLDDRSEPEPDIAIVIGTPRDYRDRHPASAVLIAEVAETTLAYDRGRKLAAYARAGIAEYWILDVLGEALEVHRRPDGNGYAERRVLKAGDDVASLAAPDFAVAVSDLLP